MRLFTAIELGDEARAAISAEQRRLVADIGSDSFRPVGVEQLHLTLVFIGDLDERRVPSVVDVAQRDLPLAPFELVFGGLGTFPPRGAPRILWLGTLEGANQVAALHAAVVERLSHVGIQPDHRPYHPHLTLGRFREGRGRHKLGTRRRAPDSMSSGATGRPSSAIARTDVTAVTLFQSRLSSRGPTYTALARAGLACC